MGEAVFWWIGVVVFALTALAVLGFAILWLWANLIHKRFNAIFFRETQRRISLASWHRTRLSMRGGEAPPEDEWPADDHVVGPRPFYLSYKIGQRRIFIMFGTLGLYRHSSIKGRHP